MIDIISLLRPKKNNGKRSAGAIAKERLKLVLIHDRSDCESDLLENIRKDIMEVLSKYMEIDMEALDIQIGTTKSDENEEQEVPALYANIPIKNLKGRDTKLVIDFGGKKDKSKDNSKDNKEEKNKDNEKDKEKDSNAKNENEKHDSTSNKNDNKESNKENK